jgi:cell division protein FtsQ
MREQAIGQRVGNRSGAPSKSRSAAVQRPAKRRGNSAEPMSSRVRMMLGYVPLVLKFVVVIALGVLLFFGYRAAASASFFQLRAVEIQGTSRASSDAVQAVVRREVAATGVWRADLSELRSHIEKLPWVRTAIVARVLPDGIRVRISERVPRAVVRLGSGRFVWVDDDAVQLGEMQPADDMPPFFFRGWNEEAGEAATLENRERVKKYVELRRLWEGAGLAERVSEVNLMDIRDVRAQLAGDDSQIEVRLGSQDLGKRLKQALDVLDAQRQTPRGQSISYVDLTQGKRAIVGFVSGAHATTDSDVAQPEVAMTKRDQTEPKDKPRTRDDREGSKKREEARRKNTR